MKDKTDEQNYDEIYSRIIIGENDRMGIFIDWIVLRQVYWSEY